MAAHGEVVVSAGECTKKGGAVELVTSALLHGEDQPGRAVSKEILAPAAVLSPVLVPPPQ